ncbi:MAG TPA: protein-disulfide reductase DsbD domain-containing protein, partial [Casimicrobiaceae bacterium]|nr:protein-disulfide reductase DsbD domain-containing protein [Casimicrobiaceae bacterium]
MQNPRLVLGRIFARGTLVAAIAIASASGALAAPVKTEHVEAELVAAQTTLVPGEALTVALRLSMQKGWHTYWQNPGDSGLPTTLEWKLPAGITAGPIEWPVPRALPAGPLVNYGYEGEALHLVTLTPQSTLPTGTSAMLRARADWLVCKEVCIPEGADLELALPIDKTTTPDPKWGAPIAAARAALARPLDGWTTSAEGKGATIELKLVPPAGAKDPGALQFFSFAESRIEPSVKQTTRRDGDAYVLTLPVSYSLSGNFNWVSGVLSSANGLSANAQAATIDVPLAGAVHAGAKPALGTAPKLDLTAPASAPAGNSLSLAVAIAFAFVGGIALNLMPCVFPVLSLKVVGFATHHDNVTTLRKEAFAFAAGVVVTFVALGLLLAGLRSAGEQLGWGFQLQSPA